MQRFASELTEPADGCITSETMGETLGSNQKINYKLDQRLFLSFVLWRHVISCWTCQVTGNTHTPTHAASHKSLPGPAQAEVTLTLLTLLSLEH